MLREVVEHSAHNYSTPYPCFGEGLGNLVSPSYSVCPFCQCPKWEHITDLITRLSVTLIGNNVPQSSAEERVAREFDARVFVSSAAATYPEVLSTSLPDCENRAKEK